jgi:hypothetical protein
MPSFTFNSAPVNSLGTGTYYVVPVTTLPVAGDATVANLSIPAGFSPVILSGLSLSSTTWTFSDTAIPVFTYPNALVGLVIAKQDGGSPASTDALVNFSSFVNANGQEYTLAAGTYSIPISFGANGAMSIRPVWRYSSGSYVGGAMGGFPPGLLYLIGTQNNTQTFQNPAMTEHLAVINIHNVTYSSTVQTETQLTDRSTQLASNGTLTTLALDFQQGRIRVGTVGVRSDGAVASNAGTLYGSNYLVGGFDVNGVTNNAEWTNIGTLGVPVNGNWTLNAATDSTNYYRYIKLVYNGTGASSMSQVEFYDSTLETPYQNITLLTGQYNYNNFSSIGDTNGIFYGLGTRNGLEAWRNPSLRGRVSLFAYDVLNNSYLLSNLVDRNNITTFHSANSAGGYFASILPANKRFLITRYSIRNRNEGSDGTQAIRNWLMRVTNTMPVPLTTTGIGNTSSSWLTMDTRSNDTSIANAVTGSAAVFNVTGCWPARLVYFLMNGLNASSANSYVFSEVEFYGALIDRQITRTYVSNGDTNGILFWIGSRANLNNYTNALTDPSVGVFASTTDGSNAVTNLGDRNPNTMWISTDVAGSYFVIHFGAQKQISINRYSIRTRSDVDAGHPSSWNLQGSTNMSTTLNTTNVNAATWVNIDTRVNETLTGTSAYYTYAPNGSSSTFTAFRLISTGTDSSGTNVLALSELELYGTMTFD